MSGKKRTILSDLKKLDKIYDKNIDYSDIPELSKSFFDSAGIIELPHKKDIITLRIDHEVLEFYKSHGKGYQTFINAILKTYAYSHKRDSK